MSIIARDSRFSWSDPLANDDGPKTFTQKVQPAPSKQFERRLINLWKALTLSTRRQKQMPVSVRDFVIVTASRRKSIMALQTQPRSPPVARSGAYGHYTF